MEWGLGIHVPPSSLTLLLHSQATSSPATKTCSHFSRASGSTAPPPRTTTREEGEAEAKEEGAGVAVGSLGTATTMAVAAGEAVAAEVETDPADPVDPDL